jgi:D-sedoheptulose 7-phosphate isomerase
VDRKGLLAIVEENVRLTRGFFEADADSVLEAGRMLASALSAGKKVLAFGNGGSAADSQHFAAELVNRFRLDRPALAAIALTTDTSILTSVANDSDYESVFSRQIEALGAPGDVALAISTSGGSPNVLKAVEVARARGLKTLGLAGRDGGKLAKIADLCLTVPHRETARIQEVHALLIHLFCEMIDDSLHPEGRSR